MQHGELTQAWLKRRHSERQDAIFHPDRVRVIKPRMEDDLSDIGYTDADRTEYLSQAKEA